MFNAWVIMSTLLLAAGVKTFMIYNTQKNLCLHELGSTGEVLLKKCDLDSESQQWIWTNEGMLMCVASSRCLLALPSQHLKTQSCGEPMENPGGFIWDCSRDRLISRNTSMLLAVDGERLTFSHISSKYSKWRSLDAGDICQQKLRFKRASDDPEEFEVSEKQTDNLAAMTEEQREYLRWYYRTEDPTLWKFVLLGVAFICLLIGFLLLGMGAMANRNRKEVAKYKAAAMVQKHGGEEMQVFPQFRDDGSSKPIPSTDSPLLGDTNSQSNGEVSDLKAGNIVVKWKDGNTSHLFSDPTPDENKKVEVATADAVAVKEVE